MIEKIITGIVLGKREFEDEHIVKILSQGGNILSLKAKGLQKNSGKNRISLQSFNVVEVEYFAAPSDSNRGRIKRATTTKEYLGNKEYAYSVIQVMHDILYPLNSHNNLTYNAILNILESLEMETYSFQKILSLFIIILRNEGYTPVVDKCIKCGTNQKIGGFSLYEGGLICEKHEEMSKYKLDTIFIRKIIEINLQKNPMVCENLNFNPNEIKVLKSMYKMFFENQLGLNLYLIKNV